MIIGMFNGVYNWHTSMQRILHVLLISEMQFISAIKSMVLPKAILQQDGSDPSLVPHFDTNLILCILYSLLQVLV